MKSYASCFILKVVSLILGTLSAENFNLKLRGNIYSFGVKQSYVTRPMISKLEIKYFDLAKNKKERNLGIISKSSCIGCI